MIGREPKKHNDLFFLCGLIEYTARKTKNHNRVVVNAVGIDRLKKIYSLADVYHCENIDKLADELILEFSIEPDTFDITKVKYSVPTHWDIAKVYKRLIIRVAQGNTRKFIPSLVQVYNSWICDYIDDYESSFYYDTPGCHYQSFLKGKALG